MGPSRSLLFPGALRFGGTLQFDPFAWFGDVISTRWCHRLIRLVAIVILAIFLIYRVGQFKHFLVKPLWLVETLLYAVFLVSYAIRIDPVERSLGLKEILVPLIGGALPFALLLTPQNLWVAGDRMRLQGVFYWMTASTSLTLWGL